MKLVFSLFTYALIGTLLLTSSCGYMSDKPVENIDVYKSDELQTCQIDVDKLAKIFQENQVAQIKCIEENFIQFTKYVKAKEPGKISEEELGLFVKRFFEKQSDKIIDSLSLIFQLNMILLKDEANKISNENITPLFGLLVQLNKEAVIISNIIKHMDSLPVNDDFWLVRKQFNESVNRFAKAAYEVTVINNKEDTEINLAEFIKDLGTKFKIDSISEENVDSLIFLKKVLVGGDKEIITTQELRDVFTKLPILVNQIFDLYYIKRDHFKTDEDLTKFYVKSFRQIKGQVNFNQADFSLVTIDQVLGILEDFVTEYDVKSFKPSVEILKVKLFGGKSDDISLADLGRVLNMGDDAVERLYYMQVAYVTNIQILETEKKLVSTKLLPLDKMPKLEVVKGKERLEELHQSFVDTASNFRYFRDKEFGASFYNRNIQRNKTGFVETNLSKWVAGKLLESYGHVDNKSNRQMTIQEFERFLYDAKPFLEAMKFWSPKMETFARNAVLLADLFQAQSNGDLKMNINETSEYFTMLLTAIEASARIKTEMLRTCSYKGDEKSPLIDDKCFYTNYFPILLDQLGYGKKLPKLNEYYKKESKEELVNYIKGVAGFARDDSKDGVPVNTRDMTLVTGALLNIESTFIRFDRDQDNIIDYYELEEALQVYESVIIDMAGLRGGNEDYAKGVFMYMVSKMQIPLVDTKYNKAKFAAYNKCIQYATCRNKTNPVFAKRLNIGKLLYYLVNPPDGSAAAAAKKKRKAAIMRE